MSDALDRALLEVTRPIMIAAALYTRRPSLMADPEWSAASSGMASPSLAYLLDALAQIPALYSKRDAIMSTSYAQLDGGAIDTVLRAYSSVPIQSLLNESLSLLGSIYFQRAQWKISHPNAEFSKMPSTAIPSNHPSPCSVFTHFSSLDEANAFTLYNAIVILMNIFLVSVYELLPTNDGNLHAARLASAQVSIATMEVLKSIDYHLPATQTTATATHGSGPRNFYLIFPIRVTYQALLKSDLPLAVSQRLWLKDVFKIIRGRAGPWASNDNIFTVD
jgi:hypothetical protein